jgi:glucosyl-3-phosphoglycerate synthase
VSDPTSWFQERTYQTEDFDLHDLQCRKDEAELTVSVVIPALDEASTISGVVEACAKLGDTLVDELVVIDGGSQDNTAELAATAGARVHSGDQILTEHSDPGGKGDSLWRSLTVTSGDIVVFVDADIRNPDPRFVWGLLGPLLINADVQLVKAFYERPVQLGEKLHPTGGGRVTELLARPLINAFWPELAGLIQPLSGEYAGRRTLLEQLPFFTGYGVELGMLIDTLQLRGAGAIAQVDLYERVHRNQDLAALSRMATGILQVALQRLEEEGRLGDLPARLSSYVQFERGDDDRVRPRQVEIDVLERPPIAGMRS